MCLTTTVLFVYYLSMAIENVSHHDCLLELSEEDGRSIHGDLLSVPDTKIQYRKHLKTSTIEARRCQKFSQ